jgi:hypothetical protein
LEKNKFELKRCTGKGSDNGANMKGKNSGVQKRISDQNPLAFFMPCGCHNLNLVLCDAAKSSVKSVTIWCPREFSLFAASVNRLKILADQVKSFALERLGDTRWEVNIASVNALRYQIGDVDNALITLAEKEERHDPEIAHEATSSVARF